ncbi:hypothetical protein [Epilithonimonas lactis]|uniref:Uncharacterized protein n=1 Tax=Epilithonimonas lactis TaxID=421072 RepID=A0A085BJE2_9FLAO|nr:hypothetical protein [Epilithonimonas lactis]KFC22587.1 hypothetical protein IO89_05905 [Epilithonimonas lactis]SEQ81251.1 hypothetical protein SAMN04488097_3096 [Epilithonimonas lactis]
MRNLLLLLILIPALWKTQINDQNIRLKVLRKNIIGKEFIFGNWNEKGGTETHLKYLGKVKTHDRKIYKFMNSVWVWGLSKRATNRILIFNEKNQYLGNYNVSVTLDLPTELHNGILIFRNFDSNCDKNVASKINLKNGLPKEFFRECKNKSGDIYSFDGSN